MVIEVFWFSNMPLGSIYSGTTAYKDSYNIMTNYNLLTWLIFVIVDAILNWVTYFITKKDTTF